MIHQSRRRWGCSPFLAWGYSIPKLPGSPECALNLVFTLVASLWSLLSVCCGLLHFYCLTCWQVPIVISFGMWSLGTFSFVGLNLLLTSSRIPAWLLSWVFFLMTFGLGCGLVAHLRVTAIFLLRAFFPGFPGQLVFKSVFLIGFFPLFNWLSKLDFEV